MIKVLFICHGNICRSVAMEFIFKKLIKEYRQEKEIYCESRAVSREEIGNDIYPPMKRTLTKYNVDYSLHRAQQITVKDYQDYDYFFVMDKENIEWMNSLGFTKNVYLLKEFVGLNGEIEDPWYTGRYEKVVQELLECGNLLIKKLAVR